jgi:hypothetical protein
MMSRFSEAFGASNRPDALLSSAGEDKMSGQVAPSGHACSDEGDSDSATSLEEHIHQTNYSIFSSLKSSEEISSARPGRRQVGQKTANAHAQRVSTSPREAEEEDDSSSSDSSISTSRSCANTDMVGAIPRHRKPSLRMQEAVNDHQVRAPFPRPLASLRPLRRALKSIREKHE